MLACREVKERLCELCIKGTPHQAKCAVKAINKIFTDKKKVFLQVSKVSCASSTIALCLTFFFPHKKEAISHLQLKDKACPTALQALARIAKAQLGILDPLAEQILEFVVEKLLPAHGVKGVQTMELCKTKVRLFVTFYSFCQRLLSIYRC